jgi:hypothetical protein
VTPLLINGTMKFGLGEGAGNFTMTGQGGRVTGRIAAAQSFWVRGMTPTGNATVTITDTLTNAGNLRLESTDSSSFFSNLNGTIVNSGTMRVNQGTGGSRLLTGTLTNQGTLAINNALTTFNGSITNSGNVVVAAGSRLVVSSRTTAPLVERDRSSSPPAHSISMVGPRPDRCCSSIQH